MTFLDYALGRSHTHTHTHTHTHNYKLMSHNYLNIFISFSFNRILQKCPEGFLNSSMLDNIINLTLASVQLDHREANSSVVKFISELIDTRETENSVDKLLRER